MQHLQVNTTLQGGKYKIEKILGQGSFGITYLAEQTNLERTVAIKEFFMKELNSRGEDGSITGITDGSLSQDYARKFQKEALNLSKIEHENIVRVLDSFSENNTFYYVMDYIDGENLNDYIKSHSLSEKEVVDIIAKVADALQYMHEEHQMLHLDMKPGNIMRRKKDGRIFLIDFGLSKHFSDSGQPETSTTIGLGTAGYAPLEQSNQSKSGEFLPTIDVYALGATMFKLLTRETPPTAIELLDDDELLEEKLNQSTASQKIKNVVLHAMEVRAKKRTPNIKAFKEELLNEVTPEKHDIEVAAPITKSEEETLISQPQQIILKKARETFTVNGVSFDMIRVEGGTFMMGALPNDNDADGLEIPAHSVTLSSFFIGETLVTQTLWQAIMGNNPSHFKGDYKPVERVSWNDCQDFISKLNCLTGKKFRLPTEAEWEFAARGGNKSHGYKYSGSNIPNDVAWHTGNSGLGMLSLFPETHVVKQKQSNELGIYDMSGNVNEWCSDWYGDYEYLSYTNPQGPLTGKTRICRGGSWYYGSFGCRSSARKRYYPTEKSYCIGLRLVLSD